MIFRTAILAISAGFLLQHPAQALSGNSQPSDPLWRQQLTAAIAEYMQSWTEQFKLSDETSISYQINGMDPRLNLAACGKTPKVGGKNKFRAGRLTLKVECISPAPWRLYVSLRVERLHPVVASASPIARGSSLEPHHLQLKTVNIDQLNYGYYTSMDEVAGLISKRSLQAGLIIAPNQLTPPKLITKGDSVLIEASNKRIMVKMPGQAMSDGRRGEQISVKNLQSQRVVKAEVIADGKVKVPL